MDGVNVKFGFVADAANTSSDGKVNALGLFDTIHAVSFPATHGSLFLVIAFEVLSADAGKNKKAEIALLERDGKPIVPPLTIGFTLPPPPTDPRITIWQAINLQNIVFPTEGEYEFSISIDGHQSYSVPLKLALVAQQK